MSVSRESVVLIAINYGSDQATLRLVDSLRSTDLTGIDFTLVIVDNTERKGDNPLFASLATASIKVLPIQSPENSGYFGGARLGLYEYLERFGVYPDWVLVSNVDIRFIDSAFFQKLVLRWGDNTSVGVVAPSIWSDIWECDRNPKLLYRPSRSKMHFYRLLYRHYYIGFAYLAAAVAKVFLRRGMRFMLRMIQRDKSVAHRAVSPKEIYAAQGSCFIFSKRFFSTGGDLSYPCFLFGEEIFVAENVRQVGLSTFYDPALILHHDDHDSTGLFRSRKMISYMYSSSLYLEETYFRNQQDMVIE